MELSRFDDLDGYTTAILSPSLVLIIALVRRAEVARAAAEAANREG